MKAFIVDKYKTSGALRFGEMPEPILRDDDVLVEIHAAGLNPLDSKSAMAPSSRSFRIARPSSWDTTWPEQSPSSD
jgi:NADPH:quinone reductase-like Zn-dependent oxidoreductase